jgi:hypothetical protein
VTAVGCRRRAHVCVLEIEHGLMELAAATPEPGVSADSDAREHEQLIGTVIATKHGVVILEPVQQIIKHIESRDPGAALGRGLGRLEDQDGVATVTHLFGARINEP